MGQDKLQTILGRFEGEEGKKEKSEIEGHGREGSGRIRKYIS